MAVDLFDIVRLSIEGQLASAEVYESLISLEVDESVLLPSMFTLRLLDQEFKWIDSQEFMLGKQVEIVMETPTEDGQGSKDTLIEGEITAVEPEFEHAKNLVTVIRGYDKSHRLYRDRKTRTFVKVKDSDLASQIASECGLSPNVDSTSGTHDYICQDNQTDMEFLRDRASRVGYYVYAEEGNLYFVKAPKNETEIVLDWGTTLSEFHARLTTAEQATKVIVRGWDPVQKKKIVGEVTEPLQAPRFGGSYGGQAAKQAFGGESNEVITKRPVWTQDEAKTLAQSVCNEISGAFIQAEGTCDGMPKLHAGVWLKLNGIGNRFSGRYRVTRAVHRYTEDGHYETRFEISGHRANTVGELLTPKVRSAYGVVIGIVTNNKDPDDLGRVKVKFANWLGKEPTAEIESDWIRLVSPMAGAARGIEFLPEVNDEVLIAFEYDDVNRPFVLGALWSKTDKPPATSNDLVGGTGKVEKRIVKSRSGHVITLDDTEKKEKISIIDKTGKNSFEIDSTNNSVAIKADAKIEIQTKGGHKILIEDQSRKIEVVSGSNSVKIDSMQNSISIESAAQLRLKAQTIQIEGTSVSIKGQAATEIEGAAMLTLKGGLVRIN